MSNEKSPVQRYPGASADVSWDGRLCIHVGECGRAQGDLFVAGRKPWCQPDAVSVADVQDVVERCPTGALALHPNDGAPGEVAPPENVVVVSNAGPLYLRGDLRVDGAPDDMPGVRFRAALCRCGQSARKPFCDNSHEVAHFADRGAVGERGSGALGDPGPLEVRPVTNGPLLLSGPHTLMAASGRVAWQGRKSALCRCGQSKNRPFCDGSHRTAGFASE